MRAILFVSIPVLAISAAAAKPKPADPPKAAAGPAIAVQVLPVEHAPADPLLLHVRVSVPPDTSLAVFCRVVSQAASIPLESAADLADQKLMAEVGDQPLGRVLEDVASLMNARLVREPRDTGPAHYRILQFKAQREAEAEIVGFPVHRLLAGLQALRDGKDPAGLPAEIARFAEKRPGVLAVLRKLPDAEWGQLLEGQKVPITDPALLALMGPDMASGAASLRRYAANEGLNVPAGGAGLATASLEVNDRSNGMAPTLQAQVQFSGGGNLGAGLVSQSQLPTLFPDDRRLRTLLQIPPAPNPLPASPEIDLSDLQPESHMNDVVAELARRAHLDLIVRQFRYPYPVSPPRVGARLPGTGRRRRSSFLRKSGGTGRCGGCGMGSSWPPL